jgi:hypothetical protein
VPESGKLVVLDVSLPTQSAFIGKNTTNQNITQTIYNVNQQNLALRENGIKSAPLWSTELREYVGMVSVSDFVEILIAAHTMTLSQPGLNGDSELCNEHIKALLHKPLSHWRDVLKVCVGVVFLLLFFAVV